MRTTPTHEGTALTETEFRESLTDSTPARRLLHDLGYFGHFLHVHAGGRSGKQHILVNLYQNGGYMAQSELAHRSCVSSAALSEVISKLETEGFIIRTRSESDGRAFDIELTDTGSMKAQELVASKSRFEQEAFDCLSEDEREVLLNLLDRIANHWQAIDAREKEEA